MAHEALALINEQLWLGHFDVWSNGGVLLYRHGLMLGDEGLLSPAQAQVAVESAIEECDRFYPAFQFDNYRFLFGSAVTWQVFGNTLRYAVITWTLTLVIGVLTVIMIGAVTNSFEVAVIAAIWDVLRLFNCSTLIAPSCSMHSLRSSSNGAEG